MIKYRYAHNSDGQIVNIDEIKRNESEKNELYTCIACGNELITRLGNVKIHHFAHKQTINCSGETYLHNLGKKVFFEEYTSCLKKGQPFYIEQIQEKICNCLEKEFGKRCFLNSSLALFDLTLYFDSIRIEERESDFIPDLKLIRTSTNEMIFIEIAVTHLSTEKKLSSKYRIIELNVDDEDDLVPVKRHTLSINNKKIKFKNFNPKTIEGNLCSGKCQCSFDLFIVFDSMKSILLTLSLNEIREKLERQKDIIKYYSISRFVDEKKYKYRALIAKAYKDKIDIKSCFLCRYYGDAKDSVFWLDNLDYKKTPVFCKTFRERCEANKAINCVRYRPDQEKVDCQLNEGKTIIALSERDEPHEDYYTENKYRLHREFKEQLKNGTMY